MALTEMSAEPAPMPAAAVPRGSMPGIGVFVRMKLRIIGNGLRGSGRQIVTFIASCIFGVGFAIVGAITFASLAAASMRTALSVAGLIGAVIVVGWLLMPTLYFGVDETLDPARFALLPLTKARVAAGMGAAALIGIPPTATAAVFIASVISVTVRGGAVAGLTALAGVSLTLLFCVAGSRALTSALAGALRTRRVRDVASVVVALMAASFGPLEVAASRLAFGPDFTPLARVAHVIAWTPFAAGFVAPYDVVAGHVLVAMGRLGVLAASLALLVWWWSTTFEDAMVGVASNGGPATRVARGGAVGSLVPWWLRRGRVGPYRAIIARELRYWRRDNRRRIAIVSAVLSGMTPTLIWSIEGHGSGGIGVTFSSSFSALIAGGVIFQVFSMDGTAFATHLLSGVPARTDVRARVSALALLVVPLLCVLAAGLAMLSGRADDLPVAYGALLATFGVAVGTATSFAIDGAFPMPEARNPFAMRTGTGTTKGLLMLVVMFLTVTSTLPVYIATFFAPAWAMLPIGVAWGFTAVLIGTSVAASRLAKRGPELLLAVTPRR